MTNAMNTLSTVQGLIDHAANQTDKWLFLFAIVVLIGGLIYDKLRQERITKGLFTELRAERAELFSELRNDRKESDKVIEANTQVLVLVRDRLNHHS